MAEKNTVETAEDMDKIPDVENRELLKIWMQASAAVYIYGELLKPLKNNLVRINGVSYTFPIIMTTLLFLSTEEKFTFFFEHKTSIEMWGAIGSLFILVISIYYVYIKGNEKNKADYQLEQANNIRIVNEVRTILRENKFDNLEWFHRLVLEQDIKDKALLVNVDKKLDQESYTFWLKDSEYPCNICKNKGLAKRASFWDKHIARKNFCDYCGALNRS